MSASDDGGIPDPPADHIEPAGENNPKGEDLRAKAADFIRNRPDVYALFERFALEKAKERRRFGAKQLAERVRWECKVESDGAEAFKICNDLIAYIARQLVADHPELLPLVRFRKTRW